VVVCNTQCWIIGGNDGNGQASATCDIFDPSTDTWYHIFHFSIIPFPFLAPSYFVCMRQVGWSTNDNGSNSTYGCCPTWLHICDGSSHIHTLVLSYIVLPLTMYLVFVNMQGGSANVSTDALLPASCECYDPLLKRWIPCAPPASRRCSGVAIADDVSNTIMLMGGYVPPPAAARERNNIITPHVEIARGIPVPNNGPDSGVVVWSIPAWRLPRPLALFAACWTHPHILIAGGLIDTGTS
jgi:hypothetical protein